jgi:RNA polymerase sigma-70 factor (ECF subfamily)
MHSYTEHELILGARKMDPTMLGAIYDRYSSGIFCYAMRLLGDEYLAEECISNTFSRFLTALHAGRGPQEHLQAYIYRIAHNWITDYYRRNTPAIVELDEDYPTDAQLHPENAAEVNMQKAQVRLALRSLTPDQRQVIVLKYLEGWQNEEIAAALEKPVGAVKALQHRALETLKRILSRDEKAGQDGSDD